MSFSELELLHVDEFVDELLHEDPVCDVILQGYRNGSSLHTLSLSDFVFCIPL